MSLIDAVVLLAIGVVLPLAVGGSTAFWVLAACSAAVGFFVREGWAGVFVVPYGAMAVSVLVERLRPIPRSWPTWRTDDAVSLLAAAFAVVSAGALAASRSGLQMFGIGEPIVELTAVHFAYGGVAALVLAGAAARHASGGFGRSHLSAAAIVCTAVAPPIVATGFTTRAGVLQVGGAALMTAGVWSTAALELRQAASMSRSPARALLVVSGLAVWVPMVLAVAWAAGQHWDVPALSIPDMVRTHGLTNAVGFVLCGLVARRLEG